ncbi:MAG: Ig-like domain-containing protein [Ferruginibacter sp.]
MLKIKSRYIIILFILIGVGCAKRGNISGGFTDTIAPVLKMSFPKNFSTNFEGNQIKLVFDENIKLKNLNKQLIISPPMKDEPLILPTTVSKSITIKIKDTLRPNTTYSLNFGNSITDNNEGIPYNQFKYVFSTGAYIDSLSLSGIVKDSYDREVETFVSIMLYEVNDNFKDSVVYKGNPTYITNTLDSMRTFKLDNLKAGKYFLVAIKNYNNNNKYNPKKDKIGFIKEFITIPNDTIFELKLFKEVMPFKANKPRQYSGNRLVMGYEGKPNTINGKAKIILKNKNETLPIIVTKFPKNDSLQIWYKPIKTDSLTLMVTENRYRANFELKIKAQKMDTLSISPIQSGILNFRDRFTLETTTPLTHFDNSKIKLLNKVNISVPFTTEYDEFNQKLYFDFQKEPSEKYTIFILPGALTDFFEKSNDTLKYTLSTKTDADYGNLMLNLENVKRFPIIVELTNTKGDVVFAREYSEDRTHFKFNLLQPELFRIRVIYDDNKNGLYDTGDYLEKRYAEEVNYYQEEINDVRANWDPYYTFDLNIEYNPEIERKEEKTKKKEAPKKKKSF